MRCARSLVSVFGALVLVGVSGTAALFAQGGSPASGGSLVTYTNSQYSFTLQYPKDLAAVSGGDTWSTAAFLSGESRQGTAIVTITVFDVHNDGAKPYRYPLFFSAWVSVGVSPDTADCYQPMATEKGPSTLRDVTIGGLPFKVGTSNDLGMMKYTNVTGYRIIHDGACYAVDQVEHGASYRDENTLPGLSDDQLQAYYDEAGAIARSFRFTDVVPETTAPAAIPSGAVTLKFARGATRILVDGSLAPGSSDSYILSAGAGQPVVLATHGDAGRDPTLLITSLPDGAVLQADSPARSVWTSVLGRSRDLLVQVRNPGPAAKYQLFVMVPALVRLPAAGGSVTRSGSTPAGFPVDYVVAVRAGETVKASVRSAGNGTVLQTAGFILGTDFTAVTGRSQEPASGQLELAPSRDRTYVLSVLSRQAADVPYRLTLTVQH